MLYAIVILAVLLGALAQRVSGMGFALVVAPVLVLLLGPFEGVLIVNLCGAISASVILSRVWRDVDWRQFGMLIIAAIAALIPGVFVSVLLGGPVLQIVVGSLLIVALTASLLVTRADRVVAQRPAAAFCGAASGFMSATAGVSGPPMSIYAVLTRWPQKNFAATLQPYFMILGASAFTGKVVLEGGLPDYDGWLWVAIIGTTLVGLALGELVAKKIDARVARIIVIVISYAGGVAAIIDGIIALGA